MGGGKQTLWSEFLLLRISGDGCLGSMVPAPTPQKPQLFSAYPADPLSSAPVLYRVAHGGGTPYPHAVTCNTVHGVCHQQVACVMLFVVVLNCGKIYITEFTFKHL